MKRKLFFLFLLFPFSSFLLSACVQQTVGLSQKEASATSVLDCPFSDMNWESTQEEVISAEGTAVSTYDSVYGGICYAYPKEYSGYEGTIKYMFNEQDQLMCIAWAYGSDDTDELFLLYDTISSSVNDLYGESGYNAEHPNNYGNVWYLESGDIVLSTMITSDNKVLQYAYLHPQVSNHAD